MNASTGKRTAFEQVVLLLQGGGALGSYQAGVYQALAEADLHPNWVAGISIGAINSAIIAGNPPEKRVEHVEILKPEICTLDLNTMNSGGQVVINTPPNVRKMAARMRSARVLPELELFDSGDIHLARDLIADGTLKGPPLCTLVLGVKYGFDPSPETMLYARNLLPEGAIWAGFGLGRSEFPMVAQSWLLGGHVRVGMEDNLYLSKGVLAKSNAELVAHAAQILKDLGAAVATPAEARAMLGLS